MSLKSRKLTIGKSPYINYSTVVVDRDNGKLIFASLIGNKTLLKKIQADVKKSVQVYIPTLGYFKTGGMSEKYQTILKSDDDFAHLLIAKEDNVTEVESQSILNSYIYVRKDENISKKIYDKLYKYTSIPILEEWMDFILEEMLAKKYLFELDVRSMYDENPFYSYRITITKNQLLDIVQKGLRDKTISINNCYENSSLMNCTTGLDSYLNIFGNILASKIQESFIPKFNPNTDTYNEWVNNFDDSCFHNGIEIYPAQKASIQASVNNLDKNKVVMLIAEMGCGNNVYII